MSKISRWGESSRGFLKCNEVRWLKGPPGERTWWASCAMQILRKDFREF